MKPKSYSIHFVCWGNTYRSRLAAAYMATILGDHYAVSSSGIHTEQARTRTSEAFTQAVAKRHGLAQGLHDVKTQTTDELLAAADIIVCMSKDVYDEALATYTIDARKAVVWHVSDLTTAIHLRFDASHDVHTVLDIAERTFQKIKRNCDELQAYISQGSWVDVADRKDQASGLRLPISWVTDRGLWHRGIHVVVTTADGKYVVGKRAKSMVFAPGMLEVSLGGLIDSGEIPLHAAVRETHEELGVTLPPETYRPLFVYRQIAYHPRWNKQTKAHIHVYAATLPVYSGQLVAQPGEVDELRLLTKGQLKRLLRTHRIKHFGRLKWGYQLYNKAVAASSQPD